MKSTTSSFYSHQVTEMLQRGCPHHLKPGKNVCDLLLQEFASHPVVCSWDKFTWPMGCVFPSKKSAHFPCFLRVSKVAAMSLLDDNGIMDDKWYSCLSIGPPTFPPNSTPCAKLLFDELLLCRKDLWDPKWHHAHHVVAEMWCRNASTITGYFSLCNSWKHHVTFYSSMI